MNKEKKEIFDNCIAFLETLTKEDLMRMEQEAGIDWDAPPDPRYYDDEFEIILPSVESAEKFCRFTYKSEEITHYQYIEYCEENSCITEASLNTCKLAA